MMVSVIIPAMNRVEELRRAVDSVLAQTFGDFEILVVDDGSAVPLEEQFGARSDGRLRFVRQANTGPSGARNTGAREARGELLAFLDSDDTWEPEKLARQCARFAERPELVLVGTGARFVDDDGVVPDQTRVSAAATPRVWTLLQMTTPSVMIRRDVFLDGGGFVPELFFMEDKELFLRVGLSRPFESIPEPLTVVHDHARRTTRGALRELSWIERYDRDVRTFARRVAPAMRPGDFRHLARKVSILQTDIAEMFAAHGQGRRALASQSLATLLAPLTPSGYGRWAKLALAALRPRQ